MSIVVDESEPVGELVAPFEPRNISWRYKEKVSSLYQVFDEELGRGKFGAVYRCKEKKNGRILAAKYIKTARPADKKEVENEVALMQELQHPRLLQLYDAFDTGSEMILIMELITGGELFERVIDEEFLLTEKACVIFLRQICEGVSFMHSVNIIHLDMKPENILCVTRAGNRIKLIDFGLARKFDPNDTVKALFGTPEFVAPEVINYDRISPLTDMWSVGVITYILLSGLSPFMGDNDGETFGNISMVEYDFDDESFDEVSDDARDFIDKLLVLNQNKRMSAKEALRHRWLEKEEVRDTKLDKKKLKKYVIKRRWHKATNAILALRRMGANI
ncbi:PREDICTED: myosin light chain kinase 2, skeletal/cardiac muscle-like [Priapulus caudatus]|uniref:Myosin light chain kinase 2, skeletal/cardiac muscle-like n=1 Tax=Priapulus caudatus TaxID=37621 RepID=A0ABM1EI25_PRICU|nr:PREDICTED: myosin light chain kinase 2, skeletal/cardiac muscle-like [Priapulus caudatus]